MNRLLQTAVLVMLLAAVPALAQAREAWVSTDVSLRAGPDVDYPRIGYVDGGTPVEVFGCIDRWDWCDVEVYGERGWIYGEYLEFDYGGRRVYISDYGPRIGIPIVSFVLGGYWHDHYRHYPWYGHRDSWSRSRHGHRPNYRYAYAPRYLRGHSAYGGGHRSHDRSGYRAHDRSGHRSGSTSSHRTRSGDYRSNDATRRYSSRDRSEPSRYQDRSYQGRSYPDRSDQARSRVGTQPRAVESTPYRTARIQEQQRARYDTGRSRSMLMPERTAPSQNRAARQGEGQWRGRSDENRARAHAYRIEARQNQAAPAQVQQERRHQASAERQARQSERQVARLERREERGNAGKGRRDRDDDNR